MDKYRSWEKAARRKAGKQDTLKGPIRLHSPGAELVGEDLLEQMADAYPCLTEATLQAMKDGWDYAEQFSFGLDLVLDALDRATPAGR